jgi:tripartite-type tricarboxylate transporter receptor subunit TctC
MRMMNPGIGIFVASLTSALVLTPPSARAESWPQRAVRVIVPFGAGSGPDFAARLFADRLSLRWKQPVIVENRPGADGLIGTAAFVNLRDDHVLMFSAAAPLSVLPVLQAKLPYDPARDVVPISSAADTFGVIATSASLKVESLAGLVSLALSRPGQLNYHAFAGAFPILFAGFEKNAGIKMAYVSYRETNVAVLDLAEGRIQVMLGTLPPLLPQVASGKVRLVAVTNKTRAPIMPKVPPVSEAGYPALSYESIAGFFGPRDMPAERRDQVSLDVRAVAAENAVGERLTIVGQAARGSSPAEFAASIEGQRAQIASIAKMVGTKPEQ